ncbi:MAG: hypothetical protein IJB81_03130 [Clostridia bacterium]|nr:hypothetical protein [Clostridia bacterium]
MAENPTNPTNPTPNPPANPPSAPQTAPQQQPAAGNGNPDAIVSALMTALESRQQRVERSITRDMATQYGMSEEELTTLLNNHRAEKAKQLSPEAQQQIDAANARVQALMLQNEVTRLGAAMGLLDPQLAVTLLDHSLIQTEGEAITGVQDALSLLKEDKPYLFGGFSQPMAWGQQHGSGTDEREADFRRALGLKPTL